MTDLTISASDKIKFDANSSFVLISEDFNKRILNPDLTEAELVKLHGSVKDLYRNYCAPSAPDRIKFEENIVNELKESKLTVLDSSHFGVKSL